MADRPAHGGWSAGEMRLVVGGHTLTSHRRGQAEHDAVHWYLLPLFEWMADNWMPLLHEEQFAWREHAVVNAATATFLATRRLFHATNETDKALYREVHSWRSRHALRAADSSALYPDIFLRRLRDDIEISWTARQPSYSPIGFGLRLSPGSAFLPVADVAGPLWQALAWVVNTAPTVDQEDGASLRALERTLSALDKSQARQIGQYYLRPRVFNQVNTILATRAESSVRMQSVPAVTTFDDAVLMFGGVSPEINPIDAETLIRFLDGRQGGYEQPALSQLVDCDVQSPLSAPYSEGYSLAEGLAEQLGIEQPSSFIDVAHILEQLGVDCQQERLLTDSIRGVAIAGPRHGPAILVNDTSPYNHSDAGKRFTLAHELCHILYDRSRARRVAHTSGPWAEPGVERRANAFAAMFLMPRNLLRSMLKSTTPDSVEVIEVATALRVSKSALVEHLYNIDIIDEFCRDALR